MSGLESPVPAPSAFQHHDATPLEQRRNSTDSASGFLSHLGKWRRVVGLGLLAVTVFLWTASNFLASTIFADNTYSKPYFITYLNTTFFILPLVPILVKKAINHPEELKQWRREVWAGLTRRESETAANYGVLRQQEEDEDEESDSGLKTSQRTQSAAASRELLNTHPLDPNSPPTTTSADKLTLAQTTRLSLEFSILWFLANYSVAACLEYTTVASSTILTSTSSVFTLLFGALFRVERFTLRKLCGVLASLAGIILIATLDVSGENNDAAHRGDFPDKSLREIAIGDALAFLSALMYGLYAVFMKKRIGDESRVDMPLFFGLVGLSNVLLLWPGILILHFTGIEPFQAPPTARVTAIVVVNSVASLVSDMAWAFAVLLTSPIVVTVGLSLTIPLSLVGQIVLNGQTVGWVYWVGAAVVVGSFVFVNREEVRDGRVVGVVNADVEEGGPEEELRVGEQGGDAR